MRASLSSGFIGNVAHGAGSPTHLSQMGTGVGSVAGGRSFNIHYARLLNEQEINRVRDKFHEDAEFFLEEALRKHVRIMTKYLLA